METVLIIGGGGYVGTELQKLLAENGFKVKVFDTFWYSNGKWPTDSFDNQSNIDYIQGDVRDIALVGATLKNVDHCIHLACISNDPSFELNPNLGKAINLDAFEPLVKLSKNSGVERFIYASSSSVYGVKSEKNVHENVLLEPLTDYSKYKASCESILRNYASDNFCATTLRPATVCGYSPRQRLDVVVNILTNLAFHKRQITVFGGEQLRPNIHISDMVDAYLTVIEAQAEKISNEIFNVGCENHTVIELAEMVKKVVGDDVVLITTPTNDNRSYHISSKKIEEALGFVPKKTITEAAEDIKAALSAGLLPDSLTDDKYFNIKTMQAINLK